MYHLRKIQPQDNQPLAQVIRACFIEHQAPQAGTVYTDPTTDDLYRLFQVEKAVLWVGETEQGIMGCCGIYPTPGLPADCAELVKFYLAPEGRGLGLGRALMEQCIQSARSMGYQQLYIESLPEFSRAVSIYQQQGFEALERPLTRQGHPGCNLWYLKKL